jgi:small-conductance mechanosensitive channel
MAVMPLILIAVRLFRGSRAGRDGVPSTAALSTASSFAAYTEGLLVAAGVLYVFLILSSLACNLFAYEAGGMRSFILAPVDRRTILLGKNLTITFLAFVFCAVLLAVNQLVFHDLTLAALGFASLSFLLFAACFAVIGNWLSIRFPKRLQFGKRMNASGVTGFLLIPILIALAAPVFLATLAGYLAQSLVLKYATLALFACLAIAFYGLSITGQGRALERSEQDILEAVSGRNEEI